MTAISEKHHQQLLNTVKVKLSGLGFLFGTQDSFLGTLGSFFGPAGLRVPFLELGIPFLEVWTPFSKLGGSFCVGHREFHVNIMRTIMLLCCLL